MLRRYLFELGASNAAYVATVVLSMTLRSRSDSAGMAAIALLPMLPACLVAWVILRQMRRLDEMHRRVQFEAVATAFTATALITFGYGFLESAGYPRLSMFAVWPLMSVLWVLAAAFGYRRYLR